MQVGEEFPEKRISVTQALKHPFITRKIIFSGRISRGLSAHMREISRTSIAEVEDDSDINEIELPDNSEAKWDLDNPTKDVEINNQLETGGEEAHLRSDHVVIGDGSTTISMGPNGIGKRQKKPFEDSQLQKKSTSQPQPDEEAEEPDPSEILSRMVKMLM